MQYDYMDTEMLKDYWLCEHKPFCYDEVYEWSELEFEYILNPEKMVIIGDQLTQDVMFGNMNNMASIWIHKYWD